MPKPRRDGKPPMSVLQDPTNEDKMPDTITVDLEVLNGLLKADDREYAAAEKFRKLYLVHDYNTGNRKVGTVGCGSFGLNDVPKGLYRLLFLARPNRVDFSDMYKSNSLFALVSPDGEFVADFQFYKYELAAYISAGANHIKGRPSAIQCGVPGSDNGIQIKSPELKLWVSTLKKCLDKKWMIYGGNDFEV